MSGGARVAIMVALHYVTGLNQRAALLTAQQDVKGALDVERADEAREDEMTAEIFALLEELDISRGFARLKERVTRLLDDSSSRRIARRVLTSLCASTVGVRHPELQMLFDQISSIGLR